MRAEEYYKWLDTVSAFEKDLKRALRSVNKKGMPLKLQVEESMKPWVASGFIKELTWGLDNAPNHHELHLAMDLRSSPYMVKAYRFNHIGDRFVLEGLGCWL